MATEGKCAKGMLPQRSLAVEVVQLHIPGSIDLTGNVSYPLPHL
mgnify:CR=1 FL=1